MAKVEPIDNVDVSERKEPRTNSKGRGSKGNIGIADGKRGSSADHHAPSAPGAFIYNVRHAARDLFMRTGWLESSTALNVRKFLRGRLFAATAMASLFVALFMGEIFSIAQVSTNTVLDVILTLVFAIFALEFLGLAMTDTSYLLGFFFWMDLLGTASMIFDISFMLGQDVTEPTRFNRAGGGSGQQNVVVVRATRAAKLGARAGRISRVLKILRFLPFLLKSDQNEQVKVARVISNQLTNALSTRVAFLTISVVILMPLFTMFTYPEEDDSMSAWTELLALTADAYHEVLQAGNATAKAVMAQRMVAELTRMRNFYATNSYGPFDVDYGQSDGAGQFTASHDLDLSALTWTFAPPSRKSSSRIITHDRIQTYFDMTSPKQQEAASSLGLILFIIIVMCLFGLVMSSSISVIALQPLERMLSVVRERCTQIFKYTDNLREDKSENEDEESEDYDDMEHDSEFVLLEKVVGKLAAIASLSATKQEPEVKADMNENDIMVLNWMQGAQVPASAAAGGAAVRASMFPKGAAAGGHGQRPLGTAPIGEEGEMMAARSTIIPMSIVEALDGESFNPLDLGKDMRIATGRYIIVSTNGGWSAWARSNVSDSSLIAYLSTLESNYNENPFHNFAHAIDVEYSIYRYMELMGADRFISETLAFSLLIAALGHDVGHTGVNNPYLIETSNELAVRYNDRSPLENMHCAKLFQIVSGTEANIFSQIEKDLYKEMRKSIIDAILHTDVTKHNEMIKELGMLYQMNSEAFDSLCPDTAITTHSHVSLISCMLLHGADVSNPLKPWDLCRRYAYLCMDEFFAQGDLEKAAGIPVQMLNDRDKVSRPNSQIGFIEFFIAPMVVEIVQLFPQLDSLGTNLGNNINNWSDVWQKEASPAPDAVGKVASRVKKVSDNMQRIVQLAQEHKSVWQSS